MLILQYIISTVPTRRLSGGRIKIFSGGALVNIGFILKTREQTCSEVRLVS